MSEPRYVSPMLDGFSLGQSISDHSGVECFPAMKEDSDKRYIVKKISLPASQVQVDALLLTGAFANARAAGAYYEELAQGVREEVRILDELAGQRGFVPYKDHQIVPMEEGVGCEVHLLSRYQKTLQRHMRRNPMTHLGAVNLGIDMCAALAVCREGGWLYVDLKPENIYIFGDQEYRIGDLGFVSMDSLAYASLPDRYRSVYTAPEVVDAYSSLNSTMDTYALGLVLYQVYNEGKLPFDSEEGRKEWFNALAVGEDIAAPRCADEEMAAIITKAIAYEPSMRWQTPAELGHALISYMQRNGAEDIPLVAPAGPEPEVEEPVEEVPAEESAETAVVEEMPVQESDEEEPVEEITSEEPAEDASAEETEEELVEEVVVEDIAVLQTEPESAAEEIPQEQPEAQEPEEKTIPEEELAAQTDEAEAPAEEAPDEEQPAEAPPVEETQEEAAAPGEEAAEVLPEEEPEATEDPQEEPVSADWIDLMDAFLAEEGDPAPEGDEPSLRQLLADSEELVEEAELAPDAVSAETADILNVAQELIEHEAPAPVVAPEPIDVPIPEPIAIELPEELRPEADGEAEDEAAEELIDEAEETETPVVPAPAAEKPKSGLWKKLLAAFLGLAAAAGIAFGAWYYYQNYYLQTIDSMTCDGNGTQVTIQVATAMDQSKLTVVCKDTYGNSVKGKLENGAVTFSDLVPGSQYIFTLEPDGFNKLVGTTSVTHSTPAQTQIIHLAAVTGQEPGSAIVSFGVEGADSQEWTLTYTAEGMDSISMVFSGHTATITGLQVGTEYSFTVTCPEDILLVGENSVKHTASELVYGRGLSLAGYADGAITVTWSQPENLTVDRWIVRCYDENGYDQLQEVTETSAVFEGITEGGKYTVEVIAGGMTLGIRTDITADQSNVSGFSAVLDGSTIALSWNYAGTIPEGGWQIAWSADGGTEQILTTQENQATLSPAAPGSSYTFTILPPEGTNLSGGSCALDVPAAGEFSANRLDSSTIIVQMYDVPSGNSWGYYTLQRSSQEDTFAPGSELALLYTVTQPYTFDSDEFETIFVIRDSEGKLVSTASHTRVWDKMWDNGYCTETVKNLPAVPGDYTLTIYLGGGRLAELPFTIQ